VLVAASAFRNRKAETHRMLMVHPWSISAATRANNGWERSCRELGGEKFKISRERPHGSIFYVTIYLDCLAPNFSLDHLGKRKFDFEGYSVGTGYLRQYARVRAGDLCGAYILPTLMPRRKQRDSFRNFRSSEIDFSLGR